MAISIRGSWTVSVKSKNAAFAQRFIIEGADSGDGTYAGEVATAPAGWLAGFCLPIKKHYLVQFTGFVYL